MSKVSKTGVFCRVGDHLEHVGVRSCICRSLVRVRAHVHLTELFTRTHRQKKQTGRQTLVHRNRETDRQTQRETERQTNSWKVRQIHRQRCRQTHRQRDRQTERETDREIDRQTEKTDRETKKQTERQRERQTERQRNRQRDRETDRKTAEAPQNTRQKHTKWQTKKGAHKREKDMREGDRSNSALMRRFKSSSRKAAHMEWRGGTLSNGDVFSCIVICACMQSRQECQ